MYLPKVREFVYAELAKDGTYNVMHEISTRGSMDANISVVDNFKTYKEADNFAKKLAKLEKGKLTYFSNS